jgi:D-cysteine desulfhydrase family pyridoxal phosphate-dependent enzyme
MKKVFKVQSALLPTPIHKMKRLSEEIGKASIYIKRDDLTGIGIGGNKLRKLDYIIGDAIDKGFTTVLTSGGRQTNHGRLTAAAAAKFGLKCVVICNGPKPDKMSGNLVLNRMLGSEVVFMDLKELEQVFDVNPPQEIIDNYESFVESVQKKVIAKYEAMGDKVYVIPMGGHTPLGIMGYVDCVKEIMEQNEASGRKIDYVVAGNGSGGTYGGLLLGSLLYNAPFKVIGINIAGKDERAIEDIIEVTNKTSELFELGVKISKEDFTLYENSLGVGYNQPDEETRRAMYRIASREGILTDPCYTGKVFNGLLKLVEDETIEKDKNVMVVHTGGTPGIWTEEHLDAMHDELWNDIDVYEYKSGR